MNRAYLMEIRYEFLKQSRMRMYVLMTFLFPLAFYTVFGIAMGWQRQPGMEDLPRAMLASYGSFGVIGACLFGFGVGVAVERGLGWMEVKRASPLPPPAYFLAKTATCMAFSGILVLLLFTVAFTAGGVRMAATQWILLWGALVVGSTPFCAMGLALGSFAGPNSAPALINVVYLPMAFCSGLWLPLELLPKAIQRIAPALPAYHLGQIAVAILNGSARGVGLHAEALLGFGMVFGGVAWIAYSRERAKQYG
jgi:ABC-2 type transport system permease protein